MINFVNITKKFNNKIVLNKVNFSIKKGSIHSFIGPNGAGKTTLIKILMRANECNQGKILFNNKEINSYSEFNQKIGFVLDLGRFAYDYKVEYYLKLVANIKNVSLKVLEERLNDSGLNNFRNIKCSELSNGWKKVLLYFASTLHDPEILILDEPTAGLDYSFKKIFLEQLKNFRKKGGTIFISSHIFSELEVISDYVTFINHGNIIYNGKKTDNIEKMYEELIIEKENKKDNWEKKWL